MKFSDLALRVHESETIQMSKTARAMKAEGIDVINLSLGEPDFNTPEEICQSAKKAIDEGKTKYPPVAGIPELREAICRKMKRENGLDYLPENVVVSNGAKHSIANLMMALVNPGDEVLIPSPYWVSYAGITEMLDAVPVFVKGEFKNRFKITPEQLEEALSEKTKVMIYSSPCNPTGEVFSQEELDALSTILQKYPNVVVISDEIYEHINFTKTHASILHSPGMKDRAVVVNGVSKAYAMTGWRLGYICAPVELAKKCELIQSQVTSGVNTPTEWASVTALDMDQSPVKKMCHDFRDRRNYIIEELKELAGIKVHLPEGAFYAFPMVSAYFGRSYKDYIINDADDLAHYILKEGRVATVSGKPFGAADCLRISYAASMDELREAMIRLRSCLDKLKKIES